MYSVQVHRQYDTPAYSGKREINFIPFQKALESAPQAGLADWLDSASVLQIQTRLSSGHITSRQLALFYLERIRSAAGNSLNAVIELNPDTLAIADLLDQELRQGNPRGPLHGIPVLLKDNIATADRMHTTAGACAIQDARSDRDAFIVEKLRKAGALLLGKTNLSEWANFMTSRSANGFSALGSQTRNPYGRFDVSGSSSGSAAAVAAGLVPLAVGTETCGSLISPGSANSIVSLKPSLGMISRDHIIPITSDMDTAGPMARSVSDLCQLLNCLVGPDPEDPMTSSSNSLHITDFSSFLLAGSLKGKRVGFAMNSRSSRAFGSLAGSARQTLMELGATVIDIPIRRSVTLHAYRSVLFSGMKRDLNRYLQMVRGHAPLGSLSEIIRFNQEDLANRAPFGQDLLEKSQQDQKSEPEASAEAEWVRDTAARALRTTRREYRLDLIVSFHNELSILYAPAGFPALTVPAGYRLDGRPVGITFVGDLFEDGLLISAGYAFEQASGVRKNPPTFQQIEK